MRRSAFPIRNTSPVLTLAELLALGPDILLKFALCAEVGSITMAGTACEIMPSSEPPSPGL